MTEKKQYLSNQQVPQKGTDARKVDETSTETDQLPQTTMQPNMCFPLTSLVVIIRS